MVVFPQRHVLLILDRDNVFSCNMFPSKLFVYQWPTKSNTSFHLRTSICLGQQSAMCNWVSLCIIIGTPGGVVQGQQCHSQVLRISLQCEIWWEWPWYLCLHGLQTSWATRWRCNEMMTTWTSLLCPRSRPSNSMRSLCLASPIWTPRTYTRCTAWVSYLSHLHGSRRCMVEPTCWTSRTYR